MCRALLSEQLQFNLSTLAGFPVTQMELIVQAPSNAYLIRYDPQAVAQTADTTSLDLASSIVENEK